MAIDKTTRKASIKAALLAAGFVITTENGAFVDALVDGILDEVTTNGVVTTTVTGTCPTGAVSGAGTGTVS